MTLQLGPAFFLLGGSQAFFPQAEMRPVLVIQVNNTTPILLSSDKSCTHGIRGTA